MRYYVLLGFLWAGAYAAGTVLTSTLIIAVWPRVQRSVETVASRQRAHLLAGLRAAPFVIGLAAAGTLCGVFVRFEPRDTAESPGVLLGASALVAGILVVAGMRRGWQSIRVGRECGRLLEASGARRNNLGALPMWVVDTPYPIAAVTGVLRPRLLVSTRLFEECPAAEMDAILRHEAAHVRRRDNLLRGFMIAVPDPLHFGDTGRALQAAWAAAAEQAADDEAVGDRPEGRANLAAALLRVARMAEGPRPAWAHGVSFYEGNNLEERVRRLLAPAAAGRPARVLSAALVVIFAASFTILTADPIATRLHSLMEAAVNHLP